MEKGFRGVWGSIRSDGPQKPHTSPTAPAPAPKKHIRGELNTSMVFDALREKGVDVPVGRVLETEHGLQEREKERESECWARIKAV